MTLDGIVPPLLVLLAAAGLLAGRRALWRDTGVDGTSAPAWADAGIVVLLVALSAALLLAMGRPLVYQHGPVRLWSGDVQSDQNSQQLADPYTLTHVSHGVLLFGLVGLVGRRLRVGTRVVVALALECAWEVLENTDAVLQRYRATTVSLGYYGDSVLNSVGDIRRRPSAAVLAAMAPGVDARCRGGPGRGGARGLDPGQPHAQHRDAAPPGRGDPPLAERRLDGRSQMTRAGIAVVGWATLAVVACL